MASLHSSVKQRIGEIPVEKRYLVTSHDAFNYFARAYLAADEESQNEGWRGRFESPEGLSPESQLSAVHIRQIIDHLQKHQIQVLLIDELS